MAKKSENPLVGKTIKKITDWTEWLTLWSKAETYEELLGLLHSGFFIFPAQPAHVGNVCFYLEIANGYKDKRNFGEEPAYCDDTQREIRQKLAQKALKVLCNFFFKNTAKYGFDTPSWADLVTEPMVFEKLLWFFSAEQLSLYNDNLPRNTVDSTYENDTLFKFLRQFMWFVWTFDEERYRNRDLNVKDWARTRETFFNDRPHLLEIMSRAELLHLLTEEHHGRTINVDEVSMKKLEGLATIRKIFCGKVERYPSLEAAVHNNSEAAEVLVLLHIKQKEARRLEKIAKAERQHQDAEAKLKALRR